MLSISPGHSVRYLTREVAQGRENYYTGAVSEGEPPGRWYGTGAEALGLTGLVDHQDMEAVYEHFVDPRDEAFKDPDRWKTASKLGHGGRAYKTADQWFEQLLDAEPYADPERREQLRLDASKRERKNIAFMDVTFSVPKSVTVLHAATTRPWTTCKSAPATRGSVTTAAARAGSSTRTTGPSPRSSSTRRGPTIRSCTSTTASCGGCCAPTGSGAPWTRNLWSCTARRPGRSLRGRCSNTPGAACTCSR